MGIITQGILQQARPDAQIVCLEINKKFCDSLNERFETERLTVVNAEAISLARQLALLGLEKADCIVSGLPFRNFHAPLKEDVLRSVASSLHRNGAFVLFQYTNGLDELLAAHFRTVKRHFVLRNVPPAFVYTCKP